MEVVAYLKDYISKTASILEKTFLEYRGMAERVSPVAVDLVNRFERFMGGKNIRGSLTKLGYEIYGGKDQAAILEASTMVEMTHAWILMHDDVMDMDSLRRGEPTIHVQYEDYHQKYLQKGDKKHFGESLAMDTGDAGCFMALLVLNKAPFSAEIKQRVYKRWGEVLLTTAFGQAIDMVYEGKSEISNEEVLQVHHFKTADYTITGPLQYGALFAGVSEEEVAKISEYGTPVGIAFQLRDDELGIFSEEDKLGKPVGSDIREGKNTVLKIKAIEWSKADDKEFLQKTYGKRDVTRQEVQKVREITESSGALAYSQQLGRQLVEEGKSHIGAITSDSNYREFLGKVADYMIERDS